MRKEAAAAGQGMVMEAGTRWWQTGRASSRPRHGLDWTWRVEQVLGMTSVSSFGHGALSNFVIL